MTAEPLGNARIRTGVAITGATLTTWVSNELIEPALLKSPLYSARMWLSPRNRKLLVHTAEPAITGTASHPGNGKIRPSRVNNTVPVGELPVTVAVKLTVAPSDE